MGKDVIVACDFDSAEKVFAFLDLFEGLDRKPFVKIGMELYYAEGPAIVREIKALFNTLNNAGVGELDKALVKAFYNYTMYANLYYGVMNG